MPELFLHRSTLHGQAHVGRVMVHALRLIEATTARGPYQEREEAGVRGTTPRAPSRQFLDRGAPTILGDPRRMQFLPPSREPA